MGWAPELGLELTLQLDGLALALLPLVLVTAAVVTWWSIGVNERGGAVTRLLLGVFVVAMSGLLTAGDAITYIVAWEATSILSYLLVARSHESPTARSAARTTLLVTGLGGIALLVGLLLIGSAAGSLRFTELLLASPDDPRVVVGLALVVLGAATKSAQVPLHGWLPAAGTAPSSASALLHAATLVIAGVHVLLRVAPLGAQVPGWSLAVAIIGLTTFVWCSWAALRTDVAKRMLAGTTSAQMGLAFAVAGIGTTASATAAVALLVVHGAYKAALFLAVGTVKERGGRGDVAELAMLAASSRPARALVWTGAVALAGFPPLAGWVTKETAVASLLDQHGSWVALPLVLGAALGVLIAARIVGVDRIIAVRRVGGPWAAAVRQQPTAEAPHPSAGVAAPLALLSVVVIVGIVPSLLSAWVAPAADGGSVAKLVLWPGLVPALAISVVGLLLGSALVRALPLRLAPARLDAPALLSRGIDGALRRASAATRTVHELPRPTAIAIVAATSMVALLQVTVPAYRMPASLPLASSMIELAVAVVMLVAIGGMLRTRHRMATAVLLGVVGYGLAGLFAVRGAPDLVLTQVVVETIVVVVFVAVLTRMAPAGDRRTPGGRWALPRWARGLIAFLGAAVVADMAVTLAAQPGDRQLSALADAAAVPVGAGSNIVNVILTDFRALDTMGELLVLALAASAVLALGRDLAARRSTHAAPAQPSSLLLARYAPLLTRLAVVMGVHLLAVGHEQPGGGFVGGLVIGAGLAMHRLATGSLPGFSLLRRPGRLLGAGIGVVALVMTAPLVAGRALGDMGAWKLDAWLLGELKLTSALGLDIGVVLIVVGLCLAALELLDGDGETTPAEDLVAVDAMATPVPPTSTLTIRSTA